MYMKVILDGNLPHDSYRLLNENAVLTFDLESLKECESKQIGYLINGNWNYPKSLKGASWDFPFIAERLPTTLLNGKQVSGQSEILTNNTSYSIVQTQNKKVGVSLFHPSVLYYLSMGMKLEKINYIIFYKSRPFLKGYIEKCLNLRKRCTYKWEKSLAKKCGNFIFGKMMSQDSNCRIKFCKSATEARRMTRRSNFLDVNVLSDNLTMCYMQKQSSLVSKNCLISSFILCQSKLLLYKKVYALKEYFGKRITIMSVEVDSICFQVSDFYNTFIEDMKKLEHLFDYSTLPESHPLYSKQNALKEGYLKIELSYILAFAKTRSKCYAFKFLCALCKGQVKDSQFGEICTTCGSKLSLLKGSGKNSTATFETYTNILFNSENEATGTSEQNYTIKSDINHVKLVPRDNRALTCVDGNRIFYPSSLISLPIGYQGPEQYGE